MRSIFEVIAKVSLSMEFSIASCISGEGISQCLVARSS